MTYFYPKPLNIRPGCWTRAPWGCGRRAVGREQVLPLQVLPREDTQSFSRADWRMSTNVFGGVHHIKKAELLFGASRGEVRGTKMPKTQRSFLKSLECAFLHPGKFK